MTGKDYTFKIQISHDNVLLNSKIFIVTDAFDMLATSASTSDSTMVGCNSISYSAVSIKQMTSCPHCEELLVDCKIFLFLMFFFRT